MIISPNKLIGMLVYRTREALNKNKAFMDGLSQYRFNPNCLVDGVFNLWHYVGTPTEISGSILNEKSPLVKFPCILDFKPNTEAYTTERGRYGSTTHVRTNFKLAIAGSSFKNWSSEQREIEVFDPLLRPIYEEFMRQITLAARYFEMDYGVPDHTKIEVYTTGRNSGSYVEMYGETIDALEIHDLYMYVKNKNCERYLKEINDENEKVTEKISTLLNC